MRIKVGESLSFPPEILSTEVRLSSGKPLYIS
jgi:hypothetical protein